jgi:hypothetical protein
MNPATLIICCGPALSGCGPSCAKLPPTVQEFTLTGPGVAALTGTGITIEYEAATDYYVVTWHETRRQRATLEDAEIEAREWAGQLRAMGLTP